MIFYEIQYKVKGEGISKIPRKLHKDTMAEMGKLIENLRKNPKFYDFHLFEIKELEL